MQPRPERRANAGDVHVRGRAVRRLAHGRCRWRRLRRRRDLRRLRRGGDRLLGRRLLVGRRLVVRIRCEIAGSRSGGCGRGRRVRRNGRIARRIDQLNDSVPRARGQRRACEEERREREARGDPSRGDADLLPPVAGRQHQLPALPSHQGAQERERSREEKHVGQAPPGSLCRLWHVPAPFHLSAEGRHIGADL